MQTPRWYTPRWLIAGLVVVGLAALVPLSGRSAAQAPRQPEAKAQAKQSPAKVALPAEWIKPLQWRCIGPANMGGRITAIAVYEKDPSMWWVATASGGLLKTTNNGVTFEHQFDHEATVSVGDMAVSQSDPNIVWVGTGENNPRNSVSYGDGVYKSTDGGKTWKNMGLKKSFQIGKLAIHPTNPDIVYVGALGRLYGPNEERGLFKTSDGGNTWEKVLYVNDKTGVTDVQMHPADAETLLVATYERKRGQFDGGDPVVKWGEGSALHKTSDGGKTWKKLSQGLPTCKLGRIGIDYYRKDPNVVYAIIESEKIGGGPPRVAEAGNAYMGITGQDAKDKGAELMTVTREGPADKAGLKPGDIITAVGDKPVGSYAALVEQIRGHKGGDKVKVSFRRAKEEKTADLTFGTRTRGGRGGRPGRPFSASLGGQRENVQARQGKDGHEYGGVYRSDDGGETWKRVNSLNPRPMYFSLIRVDPSDDRYVYVGGIQLHRSNDGGKTFKNDGGRGVHADHHALWIDPTDGRHIIVGSDGGHYVSYDRMDRWDHLNTASIAQFYHVAIDTRRNYWVYGGLQDNGSWGGPSFKSGRVGPINEDWVRIGGGDGFRCRVDPDDPDQIYFTSQYGRMGRRNLRTGESGSIRPRAPRGTRYRFNWNTPFALSHHNSRIFYCAGNYVFRSLDRGEDLRAISPEITATERGSAQSFSESPRDPDVLYVGTDDGALWGTRDGGKTWNNLTKNVGLPGPRCVNAIEASRYEEGRVYVVFDGHRSDDDRPYVYVSEDFGKTWKCLNANLPEFGSTRVLREDIANPDLLYLGTEFAIWYTLDRGQCWNKLNNNLPTVAVHEIAIHPTAGEIVAATHGRGIWVLDVSPLRQMRPEVVKAKSHLYEPVSAIRWRPEPRRGGTNRRFVGDNPPRGATLYYSLTENADTVSLKVVDINGKVVRELRAANKPGLHKVAWDLTATPPRRDGDGDEPRRGQRRRRSRGRPAPNGTYRVVLSVDGQEQSQLLKVEADPTAPSALITEDELEEEEKEAEIIDD